ncbi:MAG: hypothetical protein LBQ15_03685 [Clostridium sp.]|jgi:hypothetical protein|nr:hypothetical protein [Clostridium sp.]
MYPTNLYRLSHDLPIGSKVRFPAAETAQGEAAQGETTHEVLGYEWYQGSGNVLFRDGSRLSMDRLDQVIQVSV